MTPTNRRGLVIGLAVTAGLVILDLAVGKHAAISGSYMLGAIIAGVLAGLRPAAIVAIISFAVALASGLWNDDFGDGAYYARLFVAFLGNFFALEAGRLRDRSVAQLGRQELLAAVTELPEPGATLDETVERVTSLLVPRYAGFAAVDTERAGEPVRVGSRGTEPIDAAGVLSTPLRARGRDVGSLVLGGRQFGDEEREFMRVLGGRVALALDNAGLSQELVTVEQQLEAILENLGEAVTVQDRTGRLVFANQAAADLLGAETVAELLATPPRELAERFTSYNEDGSPLRLEQLPGRNVLKGLQSEPLVVRAIDRKSGDERWRMTKSTPVRDIHGEVVLAVNVIEDITDSKRAELSQRLLADASAVLASSLDYTHTLQRVADLAVPALADWCVVSIPRGDEFEDVAIAHSDPEMVALARDYARRYPAGVDDESGVAEVLRTGRPQLIPEITEEMYELAPLEPDQREELRQLGLYSVILVPLGTAEHPVGVLSLVSAESRHRFGDAELALARELARRAGAALENARLYTELEHVATTLQRSLLPPELPDVPGWRFSSLYMPAGGETDVGGDFYDVFSTGAGWMAVMGDVVGRGAAAASLTAMARYTLRTAGSLVGTPTMGLARLNENLRERGEMALCTAAIVLLRDGTNEASMVSAGHPLPYLIRRGEVAQVGRTGPLLGAFAHGHWLPASLALEPGDVLVLYTDGVLDAKGDDDRFGEERLERALAGAASADAAVERIRTALHEFAGGEQDDDTAVLALERL
ncbi:MAG: SpoIIE family protein phosphatase [Thermoleophilaceae bacterium]